MDFTGEGRVEVAHVEKALRWACKSRKSALLRNVELDYDEGPGQEPLHEQLRDALVSNAVRVIDLFREWDEDGDGEISRSEFSKALPLLGLSAPKAVVDMLFDNFDTDGSGQISFKEFNKLLRRDPKAEARKKAVQAVIEEDVEVVDRSVLKREVMRECSKLAAQTRTPATYIAAPDMWGQ